MSDNPSSPKDNSLQEVALAIIDNPIDVASSNLVSTIISTSTVNNINIEQSSGKNDHKKLPKSLDAKSTHGHRKRMRDKALSGGLSTMHSYELLEMLIFMAQPRGDHKETAKILIKEFKSIQSIFSADISRLKSIKGVGEVTISVIKLVQELFYRMIREEISSIPILNSNHKVIEYCKITMGNLQNEQFKILFLNKKNYLIADEVQQKGTIDQTPIFPREVVKRSIELGAGAVIMIHNHPSGDPTPSAADIEITKSVKAALETIDVRLHDHIIIGKFGHLSMKAASII
jgi:DNA repair protein RadC